MHQSKSFSQTLLAITILVSTIGTYIALSPPNPNPNTLTRPLFSGDLMTALNLTSKHAIAIGLSPLFPLAIHTSALTYFHPKIPPHLLRHGATNGLNTSLLTWTRTTTIPLLLVLTVGIPLRLISYAGLGRNFTFALAEPDTLTTRGIYAYVQHPSYTGLLTLVVCNIALFGRADGMLSCWIQPRWFSGFKALVRVIAPVLVGLVFSAVGTRVLQEERMLKERFGQEWEAWNSRTARFVPGIF